MRSNLNTGEILLRWDGFFHVIGEIGFVIAFLRLFLFGNFSGILRNDVLNDDV